MKRRCRNCKHKNKNGFPTYPVSWMEDIWRCTAKRKTFNMTTFSGCLCRKFEEE